MSYRNEVIRIREMMEAGMPAFCFDLETTGLDPEKDRIISFSAIKVQFSRGLLVEVDRKEIFINPAMEIPKKITELTGIDNEMVENCDYEDAACEEIRDFLGEHPLLMGYNSVAFDQQFISTMWKRQLETEFKPFSHLDVLLMARDLLDGHHNLKVVADRLQCSDGIDFHHSLDDVIATLRVYQCLAKMYAAKKPNPYNVKSIKRWKKAAYDRIYVNTQSDVCYYDIVHRTWGGASGEKLDLMIEAAFEKCGVKTEQDFIRKNLMAG